MEPGSLFAYLFEMTPCRRMSTSSPTQYFNSFFEPLNWVSLSQASILFFEFLAPGCERKYCGYIAITRRALHVFVVITWILSLSGYWRSGIETQSQAWESSGLWKSSGTSVPDSPSYLLVHCVRLRASSRKSDRIQPHICVWGFCGG